ncbi:hypothetical protein FRB91_006100 [Serendipita sp. 411]|nr:hypothetical protein FRB91_006100 [Serendipita sp. 411]
MSTSNSNASNLSQTVGVVSVYTKISQDTAPNSPALFDKGPASPTRSGRLSTPFTPVSSPLRKILSPRKSTLSSQPSSRRVSGGDLVQDLAASLQLSFTKGSHTEAGKSSSCSPLVNSIDEGRVTATLAKSFPGITCSAQACRYADPYSSPVRKIRSVGPTTPKKSHTAAAHSAQDTHPSTPYSSPRQPKSQFISPGNVLGGEDPIQELAQGRAPAMETPLLPVSSKKNMELSPQVPVTVFSLVENDRTPVSGTASEPEPEGSTRGNPISITDEPQPSVSSGEDSTSSTHNAKPCQRRKRTDAEDEDVTEEPMIGLNVNKRSKLDITNFDRKVELQGDIYGLEPLFEGGEIFYSFDDLNKLWVTHGVEPNNVNDALIRGNDHQSTIESAFPISLELEERESQTGTATAPLSADELYVRACTKLRAYKTHVDLGADADVQRKARDEMADAWKQWRQRSLDFIDMGALRQYGEALDSKGRVAIADALGVESNSLLAWIEESLTAEEKEEKMEEKKAALALKELASGSTSDSLDFSLYVDFGDCEEDAKDSTDEEDANNPTDADLSTLAYAPAILPTLIPLIPSAPVILPNHVPQQHVAPVPQASSSAVAFSKTPEDLVKTGPLPKWAKGVLYCNSHQSLKQWMDARATALVQKADVLGNKEKWLLDELNGPPRNNLTRGEMKIRPSTRAFNGLPDDQKPVLLYGKAAVKEFTESKHEREFVVVCRTSFYIEENGVFDYRTRPCGHIVTSHDILIRHVREQHLAQKRRPVSEVPVVAVTPDTPVAKASTSTGDVAPSLPSNSDIESP